MFKSAAKTLIAKSIWMTALVVAISSSSAWAEKDGGATSGGGDEVGLQVQKVLRFVTSTIKQHREIYDSSPSGLSVQQAILSIAQLSPKIVVVDSTLPAKSEEGNGTQLGAAFSSYDNGSAQIQIQRDRWKRISDPVVMEELIHHELAVMAGVEKTGDYRWSDRYTAISKKFWESRKSESILCSVSLFGLAEKPFAEARSGGYSVGIKIAPGKLVGSHGFSVDFGIVSSGWGVLTKEQPGAFASDSDGIIFRYVVGGVGYLRGIFSKARLPKDDFYFSQVRDLTPEITFYDPYDWVESSKESLLKQYDFGFVLVGCSRY